MLDYPFNWRWSLSSKSRSRRVKATPVSLSARSFSLRGPNDANKFRSFQLETQNDVGAIASFLNNTILPPIDSLPAGGADARWNLRQEIDCFTYGIQGSTLFVFNTASSDNADGRYWHETENRPYTIAEKLEDQDGRISWLEGNTSSEVTSTSNVSLQSLWKAVGANYEDGTKESWSYSLDNRATILECRNAQLGPDFYGSARITTGGYLTPANIISKYAGYNSIAGDPGWDGWSWNTSCSGTNIYGLSEYVYYLALLHGVNSSTSERPWKADHSGVTGSTITLPLDQEAASIRGSDGYSALRTDPLSDSLKYDLGRLRTEVAHLRGTSWKTGLQDGPFVTNWPNSGDSEQSLRWHLNATGSGTATASNVHGYRYTDIDDLVPIITATGAFTGMSTETDSSPTYSAHYSPLVHITDGDSLEEAVAKLDQVTPTTISRYELLSQRPLLTELQRENTPIVVNHNLGHVPIVNALDFDPELPSSSWTRDVNIHHVDLDTFHVYTGAEDTMIVWIG